MMNSKIYNCVAFREGYERIKKVHSFVSVKQTVIGLFCGHGHQNSARQSSALAHPNCFALGFWSL